MRVSYDRLWKKLIDEKMNKRDLMRRAKVSTKSVAKICAVFNCSVDDILELDLNSIDYKKENQDG